eukprot:5887245-Pleurochrysis_carterae.AAC.1
MPAACAASTKSAAKLASRLYFSTYLAHLRGTGRTPYGWSRLRSCGALETENELHRWAANTATNSPALAGAVSGASAASPGPCAFMSSCSRSDVAARPRSTAPAGCCFASFEPACAQCWHSSEALRLHDPNSAVHGHGKLCLSVCGSWNNARYSSASTAPTLSRAPGPATLAPIFSGAREGGARIPSRLATARSAGVPSPSRIKLESQRRCGQSVAAGAPCGWSGSVPAG